MEKITVKKVIETLSQYSPDAEFVIVVGNTKEEFIINKDSADEVVFRVENIEELENHN